MSFISVAFVVFFIISSTLYYIIQKILTIINTLSIYLSIYEQIFLLICSFIFYGFTNIIFLPFLLYVGLVTYLSGFLAKKSKAWFITCLILDLFPLIFFKYFNFFLSPFTAFHLNLIVPLGISFFTLQSISYIVDVRKNKIPTETNPITVFLYVSFFPVIASGPIQRPENLIPQLKQNHPFDYTLATDGMKLFAFGLLKKLVIAANLAIYVNYIYNNLSEHHGCAIFLATFFYTMQIYCDFSAYSDMAIGLAMFFGFTLNKNFDHPYLAQSCSEFWHRWHISLSTWLRDYVYIPLGGSRVSRPRIYINLLLTFLISGLWHGAAGTFILWGLLHGVYLCIGRFIKPFKAKLKTPAFIRCFITFSLISFAWSFFRANSFTDVGVIVKKMLSVPYELLTSPALIHSVGVRKAIKDLFSLNTFSVGGRGTGSIIMGIAKTLGWILFTIFIDVLTYKKSGIKLLNSQPWVLRWCLYIILVVYLSYGYILAPVDVSHDFIYSKF